MFFENDQSENQSFEPDFPPWYQAGESEVEELKNGSLTKAMLEEIIDQAFVIISQGFDNYQERKSQIEMSKSILLSLYNGNTAVLEAGTGIGKSFAYVIASLSFSYITGERVLITTETKNLQMQLYEKDLPTIKRLLDKHVTYELCLGSSNYLCKLRYDETLNEGRFLNVIAEDQLDDFKKWVKDVFLLQKQGHQYESEPQVNYQFWSMVNRDSDGCPGSKCNHFSSCNYFRTKQMWNNSRLLIANHHLLLFHLLNEKRTLPPYAGVVIDESHGFLKTGFSIFTLSFSREIVSDQKRVFDRAIKAVHDLPPEAVQELEETWETFIVQWDSFYSHWEVELDLSFKENKTEIIEKATNVNMVTLEACLEELNNKLGEVLEEDYDAITLNTLRANARFLGRALKFVKQFSDLNFERYVYWGSKQKANLYLHTCNLMLGEELETVLTEPQVYTSATLGYWPFATLPRSKAELIKKGYFENFINDAVPGYSGESIDLTKALYFSPFDYTQNSVLYIPQDLEIPAWGASESDQQDYEERLLDEIVALVELAKGGTLVLFTSNYLMRAVGDQLQELIDFNVYSQADMGANDALAAFKEDPNSVLLGTNSFWQGVDVAGAGLRMLIITKLMFSPPDDPIYRARSLQLEKQNKKPFFELALPQASMMLRQAFGRLIRSENDTGVVAILDARILKKSYGKVLLSNLPPVRLLNDMPGLNQFVSEKNLLSPVSG